MKIQLFKLAAIAMFLFCFASVSSVDAQRRNTPYTVSDNTLRTLLVRIDTRTDTYRAAAERALNRNNTGDTETLSQNITDFQEAVAVLQQNIDARRSVVGDAQQVIDNAAVIDRIMTNNRLNPAAQREWGLLKSDLSTLATYFRISGNLNNTGVSTTTGGSVATGSRNNSYNTNDRNVQDLFSRLETRTDAYRREVNAAIGRSSINNSRSGESITSYINDFEAATDRLKQNFASRRSTQADVEEVLNRAFFIDAFMRDYRLTTQAETQWRLIRTDLDTLTTYYNVAWNWNRQYTPTSRFDSMLTGTYRLNVAQSDRVSDVVGRATTTYPSNQGVRARTNLERRLTSPDTLVIEKRDRQVTVASSNSPQITFDADGVARTENTANGRSIKVTASTTYDGVALNYEGDRVNDFYVNFVPLNNNQLRVVRRVYLENRNETVTVASVYDKISPTAQFSNVNNNDNGQNTGAVSTEFVVPNNTRLMTTLRTAVSTNASQNNDRFTMEVTSPSEFNGAIIEGRVTNAQRSGQVTGRAALSLEFDTIRLRNGSTYRFAGIVDQVKLANGETVMVNNEGTVRDNNQTTKTVTRAGVGAALGALIGAIAGGGQGAAIGAAVGAGAGAGTVILQGRGDVNLAQGTEVMITSSAPNNVNR